MGLIKNLFGADRGEKDNAHSVTTKNSIDISSWISSGRKKTMYNNTASVSIEPEHLYRGFGYGIIRSVMNTGILTAEENIRTTCSTLQRELLAKENEQIEHPYIKLWRNSPYFSEYDFWKDFLLYIQLKGEFYIYMNRKPLAGAGRYRLGTHNLMTPTAYMKIINPYDIEASKYDDEGNVIEWTRTIHKPHAGGKNLVQKIPAHQIIRVAETDPWEPDKPFSLLDATKENLFTIENAKDFTRHALTNNINTPGLLAVEGEFETQEEFDNYVAMLQNHEEGEMVIAAGNAKTTFQDMNQNLDGASQEKIRGIERDEMLVTSGVSKSVLGIETTGLTRDVAATQKLTFVERTVVPYIKLMIETLNFDYRVNYAGDFMLNKYILRVTNPSTGDKTQELKELEVREEEYKMVQQYVDRGFTRKSSAQYVRGEIDVEQLQLENGDKVKLSPDESVRLVEATEKWQELISAGNNPEDVAALADGKMSMTDFLLKNQKAPQVTVEPDTPEKEPMDDDEKKKPTDYYDPDPEDYSTPRDEKETPADKSRKEKEKIAIEVLMNSSEHYTEEEALKLINEDKIPKGCRIKIQNRLEKLNNKEK